MGVQEIIAALPTEVSGNPPERDLLRSELVAGIVGFIAGDTSVVGGVLQVDPADAALGGVRQAYVYGDVGTFVYDEGDETTAHDGVFCLVLIGGYRYKIIGSPKIGFVLSASVKTPPDPDDEDPEKRPSFGDAYLVLGGTWDVSTNSIAVWSSLEGGSWQEIEPAFGPPLYIVDVDGYVHWAGNDGWVDGVGAGSHPADTIPMSAIIGLDASFMLKVENQTLYAPPGSRKTGATPTMPLGGTAANINDNNDSTTATTSAIGDKTSASVADRIVAQLALAAATDLIAIEARGVLGSAASSSSAMGLYYSTDGTTWTQAGAGFTLGTSAADVIRTGDFEGVTHIALVTEDKNWSTNTHTLGGLNAYDATVTVAVGTSYIVGSNPFGVLAGLTGKIVRCEAENTLTSYPPATGDEVYDKSLNSRIKYNETLWEPADGAWAKVTASAEGTATIGSLTGSGVYDYTAATAPTIGVAHSPDELELNHEANRPGALLRIKYRAIVTWTTVLSGANLGSANIKPSLALFRDNVSNALHWEPIDIDVSDLTGDRLITFETIIEAPDADPHDYKFHFIAGVAENASNDRFVFPANVRQRSFTIEELA